MSLDLTAAGRNLLLRAMAGEMSIKFTEIQLGNGTDAGEDATQMNNPLLTLGITQYEISDTFLTLTSIFNSADVEASFLATETGVLVDDPDNPGDRILYAYEYTPERSADRIRTAADKIVETQLDVMVYIGEAENVTAAISQSSVYVTQTQFDEYIKRRDNPHKVTAEQVGLDKVQNETPENLKPEFSNVYIEVKYTDYADEAAGITRKKVSFANITAGEKLGSILTKIRTAIHLIVEHLNGSNPHYITPKLIGAAKSMHYHSTNDLTLGVLGVTRGGTGGSTPKEARCSLGIQNGIHGMLQLKPGVDSVDEIIFEKPFPYAPYVTMSLIGNYDTADILLTVTNVTATGFKVKAYSENHAITPSFTWIAIR